MSHVAEHCRRGEPNIGYLGVLSRCHFSLNIVFQNVSRESRHKMTGLVPKILVTLIVQGAGSRHKLGSLVESFVPFLCASSLPCLMVLLHLRPEGFVGCSHLSRNITRHLSGQSKTGTQVLIDQLLQFCAATRFAILKSDLRSIVQGIPID
jgi:hypothetical protein